ncbi:agmatinase family protein [Halorarum salinum]|uniref:Agmatinase family protein n=1 Tax=Halorarum salinum TaxID=2743089 RepID=A0A7D5L9L8_9EURY|nr:agmatinase family protein [Halobaculum salinum]QLG61413.1 agmatinase family protein [Halobaculum salinum]
MTLPFPGARAAGDGTDAVTNDADSADPVDDADAADYLVVGAPLDATTTFEPGTRFGPERVRRFARTFDDYDRRTDSRFSEAAVHDAGDVPAWDDVPAYLDHLTAELRAAAIDDAVPLAVGGEHTVTWAGVRATEPDVLVVLDAHLDLREAYDGNPLSHACVVRRCLDGGPDGNHADGRRDDADHHTVDEVVVVGARTGSREEWERAGADDVTVVPPEDAGEWSELAPDLDGRDVYLSVDVDGADPGFAPGTGTMEPFGLHPCEMRDVVRGVAGRCVGFDVVEVNDRDDGQAAALAGKLLREFVLSHRADSNR